MAAAGTVHHVVLFRLRADAAPDTPQRIATALEGLTTLPGVLSLNFGPVRTDLYTGMPDRAQGFTHALTSTFESSKALMEYAVSAAHMRVVTELIRPALAENGILAVDFVDKPAQPRAAPFVTGLAMGAMAGALITLLWLKKSIA